jgi:hypothetical protein
MIPSRGTGRMTRLGTAVLVCTLFLVVHTSVAGGKTNNFTVTAAASPVEGGTVSIDGARCNKKGCTVRRGTTVTLTATPNSGFTFDRWSGTGCSPPASNPLQVVVNAVLTCTASFVNDALTLTTTGSALSYSEGDGAVAVDSGLTVVDPQSVGLSGATVTIPPSAPERLALPDQGRIGGSYNATTGVLTLTGTASAADYQTALRSVTYENLSDNPLSGSIPVSFQATNTAGAASNVATRDINLRAVNDAPVVTTDNAGALPYTEGDPATTVDPTLRVIDPDDTNLQSATVTISGGFQSGDELVFTNQNGITGSYDTSTGVLTLTGTAPPPLYQAALRSIQFRSTNANPVTVKIVEFKVNDGDADSNQVTRLIAVTPL